VLAWRLVVASLMLISCGGGDAREGNVFDFQHVLAAMAYLEHPSPERLETLARTDAMQHLKRHSERSGYYPAEASELDIAEALVGDPENAALLDPVKALVERVQKDIAGQGLCVTEPLRYGPPGAEVQGRVFFTWGYDIGVAEGVNASLNLAHPRFLERPSEVWYYCVHEMHHTLVMRLHPLPRLAEVNDTSDLLKLIRYLTFLEGTAVYAAYDARRRGGALADDPDYLALEDPVAMHDLDRAYVELYERIEGSGSRPLVDEDWALLESFSSGPRLWYRVGARMAATIDAKYGRETFRSVVAAGPDAFFDHFRHAKAP
jgi:hypothetical protein